MGRNKSTLRRFIQCKVIDNNDIYVYCRDDHYRTPRVIKELARMIRRLGDGEYAEWLDECAESDIDPRYNDMFNWQSYSNDQHPPDLSHRVEGVRFNRGDFYKWMREIMKRRGLPINDIYPSR